MTQKNVRRFRSCQIHFKTSQSHLWYLYTSMDTFVKRTQGKSNGSQQSSDEHLAEVLRGSVQWDTVCYMTFFTNAFMLEVKDCSLSARTTSWKGCTEPWLSALSSVPTGKHPGPSHSVQLYGGLSVYSRTARWSGPLPPHLQLPLRSRLPKVSARLEIDSSCWVDVHAFYPWG